MLTHPPHPDIDDHNMFMDINTKLGVPLAVQVRFQISAVLRPDSYFPLLNKINSTKLVPLFWASEGFDRPTDWMVTNTMFALELPKGATLGLAGFSMFLGLILAVAAQYLAKKGR